jgi:hypothetical protein
MTVPPGSEDPTELYPSIGAVAAVYDDRDSANGTSYAAFLAAAQSNYPAEPWFFWDQPLSDSGWVRANAGGSGAATPSGTTATAGAAATHKDAGARVLLGTSGRLFIGAATLVLLHVLLFA